MIVINGFIPLPEQNEIADKIGLNSVSNLNTKIKTNLKISIEPFVQAYTNSL